MLKATAALEAHGLRYAVAGGNAVAAWVSQRSRAAVRFTQDVDVLVQRLDLPAITAALEEVGFVHRHAAGLDVFMEHRSADPREGVHLVFAGERVRAHEPSVNPRVDERARVDEDGDQYFVLTLDALVRIKLTAFRDKDRTHIRDLIGVGLVDASWLPRLIPALAERLEQILDTPDG